MTIKRILLLIAIPVFFLLVYFADQYDDKQAVKWDAHLEQTPERNKEAFKEEEFVGVTKDGQEVKRVIVEYVNNKSCAGCEPRLDRHYIYFVGKTVTDNTVVPLGKSTTIEPRVTIQE